MAKTVRVSRDNVVYAEYEDGTQVTLGDKSAGQTSDGYHSFDELYRHRALLTAMSLRFLYEDALGRPGGQSYQVHKSRLHADGSKLDGFFIVMAQLPTGQISYHYPDADWDLFDIPERGRAAEWDGHTSADVLDRIERFLRA